MEIYYLLILSFLLHWLGDFVFQSDELSITKHKNFTQLIKHSIIYTLPFLYAGIFIYATNMFNIKLFDLSLFLFLTFLLHLIIDYFVSKSGYNQFEKTKPNTFLGVLIIDQIMHFGLLVLCYILIF